MELGKDYFYVTTLAELENCYEYFRYKGVFGFDLETSALEPSEGKILSMQLGTKGRQYVIHVGSFRTKDLSKIFKLLEDPDKLKVGHNLKFDFKWMIYHFNVILCNIHDSFVSESILNKGRPNHKLGLTHVLPIYCHKAPSLDKSTRLEFVNQLQSKHFTEEQIKYAALDVKYLISICVGQRGLAESYNMLDLIQLENDAVIPTAMMEHNGIYIDSKKWLALETVADKKRQEAKKELDSFFVDYVPPQENTDQLALGLFDNVATNINYNSNPQIKDAISWVLGYELPNTNIEELKKHNHPVIDALLDYREHNKSVTTYGRSFIEKHVNKLTKRIHSTMDQVRTDSGRYGSYNPNMQNVKHEQKYRTPFCTQDPINRSMISADYSGCELRLIAELSEEESWIEAFKNDWDMHSYVASLLFSLDYHEITENNKIKPQYKEFRGKAKNINFGVAYGMGAGRLARNLKISFEEAADLLENFWRKFPKIKLFLDKMVERAMNENYAISPLDNRRRWLIDFNYMIPKQRSHAANICKNMPFQADIIGKTIDFSAHLYYNYYI